MLKSVPIIAAIIVFKNRNSLFPLFDKASKFNKALLYKLALQGASTTKENSLDEFFLDLYDVRPFTE